ncbi:hypothetical protein LWF01_02695 [Saxibacter everestensis]|uniref:Uncharacterized protein n=1 Tax=Saxibacter everestensis TaxID=2909229 RepID=A0ABY8QV56_9MICO|nr:hypothetical protein LWF01_02695 [Brevibacteriaceae bacterium ZFBP1038]
MIWAVYILLMLAWFSIVAVLLAAHHRCCTQRQQLEADAPDIAFIGWDEYLRSRVN